MKSIIKKTRSISLTLAAFAALTFTVGCGGAGEQSLTENETFAGNVEAVENPSAPVAAPPEVPQAPVAGEDTPEEEPPGPGVIVQPQDPVTCYRFAFVTEESLRDNVALEDTCSKDTPPQKLTANTDGRTSFGHLAFKPDGSKLAFDRATLTLERTFPVTFFADLTVDPVSLDQIGNEDLGGLGNGDFHPQNLAFAPSGNRIAFISIEPRGSGIGQDFRTIFPESIKIFDPTLGHRTVVSNFSDDLNFGSLTWHPDGDHLLFSKKNGAEAPTLEIHNISENRRISLIQLVPNDSLIGLLEGSRPALNPAGNLLAFVRRVGSQEQVFTCRLERDSSGDIEELCKDVQAITSVGGNFDPAWTPDGQFLLFVSTRDSNKEIYMMKPDGSEQVRLTQNTFDDKAPKVHPISFTVP